MKFEQALQAMREGKTIRDKGAYLYYKIEDNQVWVKWIGEDKWHHSSFDCDDLLSEDWEVVSNE